MVIEFYARVRWLVTNLAPMGSEDGKRYMAPNLTDWIHAIELYGFDGMDRGWLIGATQTLHEGVCGLDRELGLHRLPAEQLAAPEC